MLSGMDFFSIISMETTQPSSLREMATTLGRFEIDQRGEIRHEFIHQLCHFHGTPSWFPFELRAGPLLPACTTLYRSIDCKGAATRLSIFRCLGTQDSAREAQ